MVCGFVHRQWELLGSFYVLRVIVCEPIYRQIDKEFGNNKM